MGPPAPAVGGLRPAVRFSRIVKPMFGGELEHRIGLGLAELELAESAVCRLAYHEMLAGGIDIAETTLQWVSIEQSPTAGGLESNPGHPLRHLCDVGRGRARFGVSSRRRHPSGLNLCVKAGKELNGERASGREFDLRLAQRELKVRMGRERRRRKPTAFCDRL